MAIVPLPAEEISKLALPLGVSGRPSVGIVVNLGDEVGGSIGVGDKVFYVGRGLDLEDVKVIDAGAIIAFEDGD